MSNQTTSMNSSLHSERANVEQFVCVRRGWLENWTEVDRAMGSWRTRRCGTTITPLPVTIRNCCPAFLVRRTCGPSRRSCTLPPIPRTELSAWFSNGNTAILLIPFNALINVILLLTLKQIMVRNPPKKDDDCGIGGSKKLRATSIPQNSSSGTNVLKPVSQICLSHSSSL